MSRRSRTNQEDLHRAFLEALGDAIISYGDLSKKPLEINLKLPLPHRIRLYLFKATYPPGGRTIGEHKIQLIVPGQRHGQRASFDYSGGRIVILAGYRQDIDIFILWDADLYQNFPFSRNVQVKAETVYAALGGQISLQERIIKGGMGLETVIAARSDLLSKALLVRMEFTVKRLLGGL